MGWSIMIGLAVCSLFYVAMHRGPLNNPMMHRCFSGHMANYLTTALFCIGVVALVRKGVEVFLQHAALEQMPIEMPPGEGQHVHEAQTLLDSLEAGDVATGDSYLRRRIRDALAFV